MKNNNKKEAVYHSGNVIEYTGITMQIAGGLFYEYIIMDGHKKGKKEVTQKAPKNI